MFWIFSKCEESHLQHCTLSKCSNTGFIKWPEAKLSCVNKKVLKCLLCSSVLALLAIFVSVGCVLVWACSSLKQCCKCDLHITHHMTCSFVSTRVQLSISHTQSYLPASSIPDSRGCYTCLPWVRALHQVLNHKHITVGATSKPIRV